MAKSQAGDNKHHGPYRVIRAIGTHAYELDIPNAIQKHRTFPVSLLHAAADDPIPGQVIPTPLPVIVEGEEEWEVEEVLHSRRIRGRLQYLVKWRGFSAPTWEPEENLAEVQAIDDYHERYPQRPAPAQLEPKGGLLSRRLDHGLRCHGSEGRRRYGVPE